MFAHIKGTLAYKHQDYLVVDTNGVGYKISTSLSTIERLPAEGESVKVFTHLHVREDIFCIYGFLTQEELGMFELLISVSGVGPKVAAALLSAVSPSQFGLAVITEDAKSLSRAQGVGGKMAQRIILELKDKIKKEQLVSSGGMAERPSYPLESSRSAEAVSALMVLGYTALEASRAVSAVYSDEMDLESIVKAALKGLIR